ncbi:MAG TPA: hypothetical protein VLK65_28305 [Vicinamibacteria bacterium]|nr:hypothetical protein [Vicinamibacteria bacterium]
MKQGLAVIAIAFRILVSVSSSANHQGFHRPGRATFLGLCPRLMTSLLWSDQTMASHRHGDEAFAKPGDEWLAPGDRLLHGRERERRLVVLLALPDLSDPYRIAVLLVYRNDVAFHLTQRSGSVFATVSRGDLHLLLSGPGSSGSRPMSDGRRQEPGGWNRIVLYIDSLDPTIAALEAAGARFRNEIEVGPGGKQIQVEDLDGNPIELHEAPRK